jgi:hypothetical protein
MTGLSYIHHSEPGVYKNMLACINAFKLEDALKISRENNVIPTSEDMDQIIKKLSLQRNSMGSIRPFLQLHRRIKALKRFRDHGCDPKRIIEKVVLPEGYTGKILMVAILGGAIDNLVCLRSGDLWHREILRNTENEIRDLGFPNSIVHELGGAHVRFEKNNGIVIFGTSEDFGSCDKVYASKLIKQAFKDRDVIVLK